ncbi:MAG: hypothetical protein JWN46_2843 [Acidimicrobiales bacterium]|nr:hypothetical protein [Acidimicrobiales bacterium]
MRKPSFQRVHREAATPYPPGSEPPAWTPGDFILTRGDAPISRLIRLGERLRIHGEDRRYAWCNHAALVLTEGGDIAEALGRGVVRRNMTAYRPKDYVVVHPGASPADVAEVLAFAEWVLAARSRYGYFTIASIALTVLTGSKFTFFVDGTFICSGFVARSMERTGALFNLDPVHISPADLAKYYEALPAEPPPSSPGDR